MQHGTLTLMTTVLCVGIAACSDPGATKVLGDPTAPSFSSAGKFWPSTINLPVAPEGIAVGEGHTFYVGNLTPTAPSASLGAVYKGDLRTGSLDILRPNDGKATLGLKLDKRTGYLFAARGGTGWATVMDGTTGITIAEMQFAAGSQANPTFINDVVVTETAAYFTDSRRAVVYRMPLNIDGTLVGGFDIVPLTGDFIQGGPMPCLVNGTLPGPLFANGIEATPDGTWLIINSLANGRLYRVDPNTGVADLIDLGADNVCLADGNLLHGKTLYVMQNLLSRIAVISLANDYLSGTVDRHIAGTAPMTTMARFGNSIYTVTAGFGFLTPANGFPVQPWQVRQFDMK